MRVACLRAPLLGGVKGKPGGNSTIFGLPDKNTHTHTSMCMSQKAKLSQQHTFLRLIVVPKSLLAARSKDATRMILM